MYITGVICGKAGNGISCAIINPANTAQIRAVPANTAILTNFPLKFLTSNFVLK